MDMDRIMDMKVVIMVEIMEETMEVSEVANMAAAVAMIVDMEAVNMVDTTVEITVINASILWEFENICEIWRQKQ